MKILSKKKDKRESGQVLVIIAIAMVGLAGFTALVVDGGMVYADRRHDQSTSDAASMAGAAAAAEVLDNAGVTKSTFDCSSSDVINAMNTGKAAVIAQATKNNISLESDLSNENGVAVTCVDSGGEKHLEFEVMVTTEVEANFAQLVFGGDLTNTTDAISQIVPAVQGGGVPFEGASMVALNEEECKAFWVTGSSDILADGIQVNSDGEDGSCDAVTKTGSGTVSGGAQGINMVGTSSDVGSGSLVEPVTEGAPYMPDPLTGLTPPSAACSGPATDFSHNGGTYTIDPGHYSRIKITGNGSITLNPGVYCIESTHNNRGFQNTGTSTVSGDGVLIYLKRGVFDLAGSGGINLTAPTDANCVGEACNYKGMLIWSASDNPSDDFVVNGGASNTFGGTVYIPHEECRLTGSGDQVFDLQMICDTIKITGSDNITVGYDPNLVFEVPGASTPAKIQMTK